MESSRRSRGCQSARLTRQVPDSVDQARKLFLLIAMSGTTLSFRWNWQRLFSYGELVCFASAWAIGLLLAIQGERPEQDRTAARTFASAADSLGIQAKLHR